ncbi:hypothetical protein [Planomicrobium okeanokoites]|uniref:hypothetical protein n=1 Tax=Planomicrobium okeanokoites TaxID=244 RepID=UPI002490D07A|nr:hypothetical protein [Planomicrobium okeanokoites]
MINFSKALIGAIVIHVIYFMTTFAIGYVRTMNHKPDWDAVWANPENLQSEVVFGYAPSPLLYMGSFLATVLVCGTILRLYDKLSSNSSEAGVS